ncbi:MAG: oligosaccharide flippase family protein [Rhizobiales bacterium]|nr:oligosaccharide flippase family protein [Hyphomicrobiales bacterium]
MSPAARMADALAIARAGLIQAAGIATAFAAHLLVARTLGIEAQGAFQVGLGWIIVLATVGRLGLEQLAVREVAAAHANGNPGAARRYLGSAFNLAVPALAVAAACGLVASLVGPAGSAGGALSAMLPVMMLAVVPAGLTLLVAEALRGWQQPAASALLQYVLPWFLLLALAGTLALAGRLTPGAIGWLLLAANGLAFVAAFGLWRRATGAAAGGAMAVRRDDPGGRPLRAMLLRAAPFFGAALAFALFGWVDVIVLGLLASAADVGLFGAVLRTGGLIGNLVIAANIPVAPRIARAYAAGALADVRAIVHRNAGLLALLAGPVMVLVWLLAERLMGLWGEPFRAGAPLLVVYAAFQTVNLVVGLFFYANLVTGGERVAMLLLSGAVLAKGLGVAAGYLAFGIDGAVWASGLALLVLNGAALVAFRARLSKSAAAPEARPGAGRSGGAGTS